MDMTQIAILWAIGLIGGGWNAIAGGATLFTFRALMAVGLPPVVANATNYLALLPSNAAALPAYRQELRGLGRTLWPLLVVSGTGANNGKILIFTTLFICSIYGGYFGAGLGIILLAIAQIMGFSDFHVANSIKNLLATSFTVLSIVVFGIGGLIAWPEAGMMMVGSTIGGYFGGRFAKHVNPKILRTHVIAFGLILSSVYFWRTFIA